MTPLEQSVDLIRSFNVWNDDDVKINAFELEEYEDEKDWMGNVTLSLTVGWGKERREVCAGIGPEGVEYSEDSYLDSASEFWCWMYFDYCDEKQS